MGALNLNLVDLTNPSFGGAGSGAILSPWVHLQRFLYCYVTIDLSAAAESITVSALQATDEAGSVKKALSIPSINLKFGTEKNFTWERVEADTYQITSSDAGIAVISFDVSQLDVNAGFQYIQVQLSGSGAREQGLILYPAGGKVVRLEPRVFKLAPIGGWTGLENCEAP